MLYNPIVSFAESTDNKILVKTIDNSDVIKYFKENFSNNSLILSRNGFGENTVVGTPFSVEYQAYNNESSYLFYFPIINNGEITTYAEVDPSYKNDKNAKLTAVGNFYDYEGGLEKLNDGNVYAIINDKKTESVIAISDNKIITLLPWHAGDPSNYEYDTPYKNKETKIVNIMEPIDIDISSLIPKTEEEKAIFEDAQKNGKTVIQRNVDLLGAINKNNRLLVPLRAMADIIDCTVEWDGTDKTAYAKKGNNTVKFKAGSNEYSINDDNYSLDVPAEIYNGRIFVPIRAAVTAFGADIAYNGRNKNIVISY